MHLTLVIKLRNIRKTAESFAEFHQHYDIFTIQRLFSVMLYANKNNIS